MKINPLENVTVEYCYHENLYVYDGDKEFRQKSKNCFCVTVASLYIVPSSHRRRMVAPYYKGSVLYKVVLKGMHSLKFMH